MKLYKRIYLKLLKEINFKKYAKNIGVCFKDDIRLVGNKIDFGSEPYLINIGEHVTISGFVTFITHDGSTYVFRNSEKRYENVIKYGKIEIGNNCFIGNKSIIMPGVKIGNNCVIGTGSVVTKSVPDNSIVAGNPAKYICSYEEYCEKCLKANPLYDIENYKKNKKEEVIKICNSQKPRDYIKKIS